jgi:cytochrome c553
MFARIFCFASLVLLACAFTLNASDCRRVVTTGNYVAPVYNTPTYAQHYYYDTVLVPKAFAVQVRPDYFAQPSDEARQAEFARLVAKELYGLIQAGKGTPPLTNGTPPLDVTPKENIVAPKDGTINQILATRCASCHKKGATEPDLSIDPAKIPESVRLRSFIAVSKGRMPKGKPAMEQKEFNVFADWADEKPIK